MSDVIPISRFVVISEDPDKLFENPIDGAWNGQSRIFLRSCLEDSRGILYAFDWRATKTPGLWADYYHRERLEEGRALLRALLEEAPPKLEDVL